MEKTLYTMADCSGVTASTTNVEWAIEANYLSKEETEKRMSKLDKKISALKTKVTKLEKKIKEVESQQWKFKVGDVVLYDGWRKVRITGLVDFDGYLYAGEMMDNHEKGIMFRPEELQPFHQYNYENQLIEKIWELKVKSKMRGGKE